MGQEIEGLQYLIDDQCPICGKPFTRTKEHAYRSGGKFLCSYTCMRIMQKRAPAPNKGGRPRTKPIQCVEHVDRRFRKTGKERVDECMANILEKTRYLVGTQAGSKRRKAIMDSRTSWLKELETALEEIMIEEEQNEQGVSDRESHP